MEDEWGVTTLTEQRVQVSSTRFRIPDVCLLAVNDPNEPIVHKAPIVCIEILSRDDRMSAMKDRIADYLAMGVGHIWFLDPVAGSAVDVTKGGIREVNEETLRAAKTQIALPIAELFRQLQNR